MKPKHYYLEIYRMNYYFFNGFSRDLFRAYSSKYFNHEIRETNFSGKCLLYTDNKGSIVSIWYDKKDKAALAHECVHAAVMTLEKNGIDYNNDDGETLAYLVGHLYEKALCK